MSNHARRVADPELVAKRLPQIINAAIQQFGRNGFHSTTIQDIAKTAGISIGMIYQYVSDKEELLYLSVNSVVEDCIQAVEKARKEGASPLQRYVGVVDALTRVIDRRHAESVVGYRESHSMSREHMKYVMKREREIGQVVTDCIEECIEAGVFRPVNVDMLMYQSIIFAHNWALNSWRFTRAPTVDDYLEEGVNLLIKPVLVDADAEVRVGTVASSTARPKRRSRVPASSKTKSAGAARD